MNEEDFVAEFKSIVNIILKCYRKEKIVDSVFKFIVVFMKSQVEISLKSTVLQLQFFEKSLILRYRFSKLFFNLIIILYFGNIN